MDYRVELPAFSGPLDLLLHLVKRQEVSIHEIQISRILGDYLVYVRALETLDLDNIGDFLVMATTLMEIKSREILPRETVDLREELDPRDDLIRQLIEYNRYREITRRLEGRGKDRERRFSRGTFGADSHKLSDLARERWEQEIEETMDLEDLDVWFLLKAYAELLQETDFGKVYEVEGDDKPLAEHIAELRARLEDAHELRFKEAFDPREGRSGLIGAFMALLELMKQGEVRAEQDRPFGEIWLRWIEPSKRIKIFEDDDEADGDVSDDELERVAIHAGAMDRGADDGDELQPPRAIEPIAPTEDEDHGTGDEGGNGSIVSGGMADEDPARGRGRG